MQKVKKIGNAAKKSLAELRSREHEIKVMWGGFDRFLHLVSVDLSSKFTRAQELLKKALIQKEDFEIMKMVAMMHRAWDAMIDEATSFGYQQLDPYVRCFRYDNDLWYIVDNEYEYEMVKAKYSDDGALIITIEELIRSIPKDVLKYRKSLGRQFDAVFEYIKFGTENDN